MKEEVTVVFDIVERVVGVVADLSCELLLVNIED